MFPGQGVGSLSSDYDNFLRGIWQFARQGDGSLSDGDGDGDGDSEDDGAMVDPYIRMDVDSDDLWALNPCAEIERKKKIAVWCL